MLLILQMLLELQRHTHLEVKLRAMPYIRSLLICILLSRTNGQGVVCVPYFLVFNILCLSDYAVVFYFPKSQ